MAREFFRIVRGETTLLDDFRSPKALGKRLPSSAVMREWSDKVSVYDSMDRVRQVREKFRFRLGSYVVKIVVPEDGSVDFRQTFEDRHHFTLYATPETIIALVEGAPVPIPGAPGDC